MTEAGKESPPELQSAYPEWALWLRAAERLNCSVFELLNRHDLAYWLSVVAAADEFESWQVGRHARRTESATA